MKVKTTSYRKFKFFDYRLSFHVREVMYQELSKYDFNNNGLFEENEIKEAMITILNENQNQVHYVVKNVFRYDRDNDKMVTYDEFINFSVEQHFGEMAIQRLHRKNWYKEGDKKIMDKDEFVKTLDFCLDPIHANSQTWYYEKLFADIDLDGDAKISYSDYFTFLREYFGSQRDPDVEPPVQPPVEPVEPVQPDNNFIDGNGETAEERFAKLIYTQFKITVMDYDKNRKLILEEPEVENILSNSLSMTFTEITQQREKIMEFNKAIRYDDFMRNALVIYFTESDPKRNGLSPEVDVNEFMETVHRATHFVNVKPADHVLLACFNRVAQGRDCIGKSEYINMMRRIFENFQFDTRGLPRVYQEQQPTYMTQQAGFGNKTSFY